MPINFHSMPLPASILQVLDSLNYTQPTPIQSKTIPLALENNDVIGLAQTGTGKTLAFSIPLINHILSNPSGQALILTPTRELAQQVANVIKKLLSNKLQIKVALLIGGEPIFRQVKQLKALSRIIVGTPGRVIDHLSRKTLKPNFSFLVLDETDRMFDMGFGIQLEQIIGQLPKVRQTLMFSATMPPKIEKLATKYLINPKRIFITPSVTTIAKLKEETIQVKESEKYSKLLLQLKERNGSIIIFVKTKSGAEILSNNLRKENHRSSAMHGDLKQSARGRIMNDFRNGKYQIMVATDVAARGLDVPHIQHVINYDLPNCPEDYIHRIGRTARAGAEGAALNLVSRHDQDKWVAIQRFKSTGKYQEPTFQHKAKPKHGDFKKNNNTKEAKGRKKFSNYEQRPNKDNNFKFKFKFSNKTNNKKRKLLLHSKYFHINNPLFE